MVFREFFFSKRFLKKKPRKKLILTRDIGLFSTGYLQIDLEQIVGKGFMAFFHSMLNKYHTQKVLPRSNDRKFAN